MPQVGNSGFALTCGSAPPRAPGVCFLATSGLTNPVTLLGVEMWLDPTTVLVGFSVASDAVGAAALTIPIPNDPALVRLQLDAQFFWVGPSSPPPCPPSGLSASNALEIVVQP